MLGILLIVSACGLWALDTLIRYPLISGGVSALNIVFFEHSLLSLIFSIVFFKSFKRILHFKKSHFFYFFMVGAVGSALATLAFTKAFAILNPSLVILLQKFQPIFAILLAGIVLKEKLNRYFIFWGAVSLVGALLISGEDLLKLANSSKSLQELYMHDNALMGYLLVTFSVVGWGAATVFGKKLTSLGYTEEQIMSGRFLMGLLVLIPFVQMEPATLSTDIDVYGKITLMVVMSGLLAMYLYYQGLKRVSARAGSLAEMFFPFMAVIVNWIFLGSTLTPIQILGGVLLIISSIVIQTKHY